MKLTARLVLAALAMTPVAALSDNSPRVIMATPGIGGGAIERFTLRFSQPMVPLGDPRATAPVAVECATAGESSTASTPAASGKSCGGKAADSATPPPGSGLFAATWDGAISVSTAACTVRLGKGQSLYVDQKTGASLYLPKTPGFLDDGSPRPDKVPFDYDQLFGAFGQLQESDGLYAYVRDGHVLVSQDGDD